MNTEIIICIGIWAIVVSIWNVSSWLKHINKCLDEIDTKLSKEYRS